MRSYYLILPLVFSLVAEPAWATSRQEKEVMWVQFRDEVASRRLNGRSVTIGLSNGETVRSTLRRIEADSLVVESNRNTEKRWRATGTEVKIPRAEVTTVQFAGRQGRAGMIGGLVGLGASGAVIGGAVAATPSGEGHGMEAIVVLIPMMALGGYFIGRHYDKTIPQFRIVP